MQALEEAVRGPSRAASRLFDAANRALRWLSLRAGMQAPQLRVVTHAHKGVGVAHNEVAYVRCSACNCDSCASLAVNLARHSASSCRSVAVSSAPEAHTRKNGSHGTYEALNTLN